MTISHNSSESDILNQINSQAEDIEYGGGDYDACVYIEGNFTPSHLAAIKQLDLDSVKRYDVLTNNCAQTSINVLRASYPKDGKIDRQLKKIKRYVVPWFIHKEIINLFG